MCAEIKKNSPDFPAFSILSSSFSLLYLLVLAGVERLSSGGVCVCYGVHRQQSTDVDVHACACSICDRRHGGSAGGLPGPSLVAVPGHSHPQHLTISPLLLDVP